MEFGKNLEKNKFVQKNISKEQQQALSYLERNDSIIIKPADKGGAIVVMDKVKYDNEVQRQLMDTRFYEKFKCDPTKRFTKELRFLLEEGFNNGDISVK